MTNLEKTLSDFNKEVIRQARANLTRMGKRDSNKLYKGMESELGVSKNSFYSSITFGDAQDYWSFIDKGVKGVSSSSKAPQSPYKFGTGTGRKGGLTKGIDGWVRRKRFQFRNKEGKFLSYDSTAFLIRRSIWNTGLKTTNFISKPFEASFKRLPDEVIEAYNLDLDGLLKFVLKN